MARAATSARTSKAKKNGTNGAEEMESPSKRPNGNVDESMNASAQRSTGMEEMIRRRAFELFQQDGAQHGRDQEHWFRAEAEIRSKTA
jgi:hypothetical protein